jgi:hypothetical protein
MRTITACVAALIAIGSPARPQQTRDEFENYLSSWLNSNRDGVLAWAAGLSDETLQAEVARYLVPRIVKDNPASAAGLVASLSSEQARHELLGQVLGAWSNAGWEAGLAWAQQLPESPLKEEALIHLSYRWLEVNPRDAVTYAASLSACNSQLVATLASQWAMRDPSAAANWAANLPDTAARRKILPSLIASWARQSPPDAAGFVAGLPPDDVDDQALISVVSSWSRQDPRSASAWLSGLPDSSSKQRALAQIATIWAGSDPQAAETWLRSEWLGDSRDAAIAGFSNVVARTSPEKAFDWAEQMQDERFRERQLESIAMRWLEKDSAGARHAIQRSSLPQQKKEGLLGIAR